MLVTLKHIDVPSAFKLGGILMPVLYTVNGFMLSMFGLLSVSVLDYARNLLLFAAFGAVGAAASAYAYNHVVRRFGALKLFIEVVPNDEPQDES